MARTLIKSIDNAVEQLQHSIKSGNKDHEEIWEDKILWLKDKLPSGSGFDSDTTINIDKSKKNKIVLETSFHHMDENGMYCGWSHHAITVTPDFLSDFDMKISSKDERSPYVKRREGSLKSNGFIDYLWSTFYHVLSEELV